jgi:hypothetical protein
MQRPTRLDGLRNGNLFRHNRFRGRQFQNRGEKCFLQSGQSDGSTWRAASSEAIDTLRFEANAADR